MTRDEQKKRKRKALLAAGLILGVGGVITLATWSGQEFAGSEVHSAGFELTDNIEASADQETWRHDTSQDDVVAIDFGLTEDDGLLPGDAVAAPLYVRLMAGTTEATSLQLGDIHFEATANDLAQYGDVTYAPEDAYGYRIVQSNSCSATTTGPVLGEGTTLAGVDARTAIALEPGLTVQQPGETVPLCVILTAGDELALAPDTTTRIVWELQGVDPQAAGAEGVEPIAD